jgi:hypothetical protein
VSIPEPGYDEIVLTVPDGTALCNSLACVRAGRAAEVIVTYGVLNDPGASLYSRGALWREQWGMSCPLCSACWEQSRQVAVKYRPALVVIDATGASAAPQTSGGLHRHRAKRDMSDPGKRGITDQRYSDDAVLRYLESTEPKRTNAEWLAYFKEQFDGLFIVTAPEAPGGHWRAVPVFGGSALFEWAPAGLLEEMREAQHRYDQDQGQQIIDQDAGP